MSFTKSILRSAGGGSMATSAPAAFAPRQASRPTRRSCAGERTEGSIRLQEAQSIVTQFLMACSFGRFARFLNESVRRRQNSAHSRLNRSKIARQPAPNKGLEAVWLELEGVSCSSSSSSSKPRGRIEDEDENDEEDEGAGSWRALFRFCACIGTMNQIGTPLPALSPQGGERVAAGRERGSSWRAPFRFSHAWDHEPPLTRPSATLSPSDGEREGVRGRFMESLAPPYRHPCPTGLAF